MYPCEHVDLSSIESAPFRFSNSVELAITPGQVFEVLSHSDAWPHWVKIITNVTRSSPKPYSVGTTRTIHMRAGLVGDEEFLAWEPNSHFAFRFNACSTKAIAAFAEDYRVVQTPGGSRLTWTVAAETTQAGTAGAGPRPAGDETDI